MSKFVITDCGIRIPINLKKFFGVDTLFPEKEEFKKVDKHTRAGKNGKLIVCPHCKNQARVYHFAWGGLSCQECKKIMNKYDCSVFHEKR